MKPLDIVARFRQFEYLYYPWVRAYILPVDEVTGDKEALGCFYVNGSTPTIEYRKDLDGEELVAILMHEYGHLLNVLNDKDNEEHGPLWLKTQARLREQWLEYLYKERELEMKNKANKKKTD